MKNIKKYVLKIIFFLKKKYNFSFFNILSVSLVLIFLGCLIAYGINYGIVKRKILNKDFISTKEIDNHLIINNLDDVNSITSSVEKVYKSVVTLGVYSGNLSGEGSGIIIDQSGYIVTNSHVVTLDGRSMNSNVEVQLSDGRVYKASIIGIAPLADLAILKIDASNLENATFGNSQKLNVGDRLIAIGASLGLSGTVTDGIVSNLSRTITIASSAIPKNDNDIFNKGNEYDKNDWFNFALPYNKPKHQKILNQGFISINVIQTDAAINPGNSGGALINTKGQVVGVNVAIASTGDSLTGGLSGSIGVGFSIPSNYVKRIANELINKGVASHGYLGVSVRTQKSNIVENSNFSIGAKIVEIVQDSPAYQAGMQIGDLITKVNNTNINDSKSLTAIIKEKTSGEKIKVHFIRNNVKKNIDINLIENIN